MGNRSHRDNRVTRHCKLGALAGATGGRPGQSRPPQAKPRTRRLLSADHDHLFWFVASSASRSRLCQSQHSRQPPVFRLPIATDPLHPALAFFARQPQRASPAIMSTNPGTLRGTPSRNNTGTTRGNLPFGNSPATSAIPRPVLDTQPSESSSSVSASRQKQSKRDEVCGSLSPARCPGPVPCCAAARYASIG